MQLSAALGWVRRQLTLTTLLSAVFVGYFGNSMLVMYRVAVPAVPSIYREDGSKKPVIESLWNDAPGLDAELWLSTDQTFVPAESVRLYQGHELPFTWDLNVELDLLLEFSAKRGRPLQLRARCDDMALPISEHCRAAAAVWTASSPDVNVSTSGSGATSSLVIGAWEGAVARALREALRQGRPVFAHVFVAWAGKPLMPGAPTYSAFHATNARTAIVQVHGDLGQGTSDARFHLSLLLPVFQSVAYVPPKLTRNLWVELVSVIADWIGVESPYAPVVPHARISATGGNASGLLQTAASRDRGDAQAVPITGDMWPHWAGQLDVRLIMGECPRVTGE